MANALVGLTQLLLLGLFIGSVVYLNSYRPANTHYRPFRIRWWVPTVAGCTVVLLLASLINLPHYLQHTNALVAGRHAEGRAECQALVKQGALHSERAALFAKEYFHDKSSASHTTHTTAAKSAKGATTVSDLLRPLLNMLLFNSGVTICAVPLLVYLAMLHIRRPVDITQRDWSDVLRRESGVLLPVLNFITLVSAFTAPTFYLFIQPGRVDRCIYTSGHWFTFSITLLTFSVIVAHLSSYRQYCHSSKQLLAIFIVWLGVYLMCALSVLKRTQEAFHDSTEAVDGIMQSLPAFVTYMVLWVGLQYATFISTDTHATPSVAVKAMSPADTAGSEDAASTAADEKEHHTKSAHKRAIKAPAASPAAVPMAPAEEIPTAPDIPLAPPPPSAPTLSTPAPPITTKQRKSAGPSPPPPTDSRDALLGAIGNKAWTLRPTQNRPVTAAQPAATGVEKLITDMRRKFLEPDGEQSDGEDDKWE